MSKTEFNAAETKLMAGLREVVEDGISECVQHMKDPTTLEGKPCTLTLTVTITPDISRQLFSTSVQRAIKLSSREGFATMLAAPSQSNGKTEITEYNPQLEMPFVA